MKTNFFYPSKKCIDGLSPNNKAQLPFLVNMSLIMFFAFFTFSCVLFLAKYGAFAGAVFGVTAAFFLPLIFLKLDKVLPASFALSFGLFAAILIILFLSPNYETPLILYRNAMFVIVMSVTNMPVSLHKRQNFVFCLCGDIVFFIALFTHDTYLWQIATSKEIISAVGISVIGFILVIVCITLFTRFNLHLMEDSLKKGEESEQALNKITKAFDESREVLNVGQQLKQSVETALTSAQQIQDFQSYLDSESRKLNTQTDTVSLAGQKVSSQAKDMKSSIEEQSNSISTISSAMTEISANLTSINNIASKQRESINKTLDGFSAQTGLLHKLVSEVDEVKRSSDEIASLIHTINSVSDQTNLLAMNASIEAAHAGTAGKGFAVISQEIRKLSEETRKSSDKITETLQGNSVIVAETAQSVKDFATVTEKSTQELTQTINEIEQILAGISEMDLGTRDVLHSLQVVVEESNTNSQAVENVAEGISDQEKALNEISDFSGNLMNKIEELNSLIVNIKDAIQSIDSCAAENTKVVSQLSSTFQ